jgi:hypothetical protein
MLWRKMKIEELKGAEVLEVVGHDLLIVRLADGSIAALYAWCGCGASHFRLFRKDEADYLTKQAIAKALSSPS